METEPAYTSKRLRPHSALAPFVDSYWYIEAPPPLDSNSYGTMFPLGYPMIGFNLSDGWVTDSPDQSGFETIGGTITSFTSRPFRIQPAGKVRTVSARLHPLALRMILGDDIRKNTIFDPYLVFSRKFSDAEERVASARSWDQINKFLDEFFLAVFSASRIRIDNRVRQMTGKIISEGGATNIQAATKELGLSQKRVEQLFYEHVGMSPKAYAGIVRFQKVLASYSGQSMTDLAHEAGYYDQSHFIRQFKRITQTTPRKFFSNECIYTAKITNLYNFLR